MSNFDVHVERVLKHEGGYVNHPRDPGGETNFGITWPILRIGIADEIVDAHTTIKSLTRSQAKRLYYEYYYKPWLWITSDALRFQVFDAYVNHSPTSTVSMLQRAVGVPVDGDLGPVTKTAVEDYIFADALIFKFLSERQTHFLKQPTFDTFGEGWMRRMVDNMRYAAEDL